MSDTRNHTTRDQLAEALEQVVADLNNRGAISDGYGWTEIADALLASDAIAAVRAAAVAETTAAIEAVAQTIANAAAEPVENFTPNAWRQLLYMAAHDVRAALSGGRTALNTCAACGQPNPDGPTASDGKPWCSACADAGEVAP